MDKQHAQDRVKQLRASVTRRMDTLNDDEIAYFDGVEEKLYGKLKERYGINRNRQKRHSRNTSAELSRSAARWESEGGQRKGV